MLKKYIVKYKLLLELVHLEMACEFSDITMVLFILDHKLSPTQKCFDNTLKKINFLGNWNTFYVKKNRIEDVNEISILLEYGYKLTQNDFVNLTKKLIYVENYQKYGLMIDENIKDACNESMFYPYQELRHEKIEALESFSCDTTPSQLKRIIKKYKIDPDINFMRIACANCRQTGIIDIFVVDHKIYPDYDCIKFALANKCCQTVLLKICYYIKSTPDGFKVLKKS